jgi:hypothetical protein
VYPLGEIFKARSSYLSNNKKADLSEMTAPFSTTEGVQLKGSDCAYISVHVANGNQVEIFFKMEISMKF